jgi:Cu(I)/Ag(I) efflux system periplasmic protein CusF
MNLSARSLLAAMSLTLLAPKGALAADLTDGEVRKIDSEAGKITLRHAEIKSLEMPAMTMVFVLKDKALLGQLKVGDKVTFKAISENGKYTVTEIQPKP